MKNSELPDQSKLLPGSAHFHNHPGYSAEGCELREVVVAQTSVTNNGFRCFMTGGHCVPGEQCEGRRAHAKEMDAMDNWEEF